MGTVPLPLQRPHPPIVVTAVAPFSQGITEAAARGWEPISANFLLPKWVATHWTKYVEGCERAGRAPDPANWRVAKSVFVAQDDATAKAYATGTDGPYYYYYRSLFGKLKRRGALGVFKSDPKMPDEQVTLEDVIDKLVIHGSPRTRRRPADVAAGGDRPLRHDALCRRRLDGPRTLPAIRCSSWPRRCFRACPDRKEFPSCR